MIVITTPTGSIGHQVLDNALRRGGESIRVIAREPSRLSPQVAGRVEVVQGSMDDLDVVTRAFDGADAVFWLVPPYAEAQSIEDYVVGMTRPACEAIKSQGVKRVVAVSSLGREESKGAGPFAGSFVMDGLIEDTGVSYRALRMPGFMENMLQHIEPIKHHGIFSLPVSGDRKLPTIATRDIAAAAAGLLLDDSWSGQKSVPLLGPEDLTYNEMAQIMSETLERPIRFQQVPSETYKATLKQYGMNQAWAQRVVDMLDQINQGIYNAEPRTPQSTTPTTFRHWCQSVLKPAAQP